MRNPNGYAMLALEDGSVCESDTVCCRHCNRHTHIKPKQDPADLGGLCYVCGGFVCPQCVGKGCDEIERKLERAEAAYHARRSYGLA
jgi:hypothetical protein